MEGNGKGRKSNGNGDKGGRQAIATMAMVTATTRVMETAMRWRATKRVMARAARAIAVAMRMAGDKRAMARAARAMVTAMRAAGNKKGDG